LTGGRSEEKVTPFDATLSGVAFYLSTEGDKMGLGDNRRSPKMRRKIAQRKLKERIARKRVAKAEARSSSKSAPAKAKKTK
jgi:hypothetical protein